MAADHPDAPPIGIRRDSTYVPEIEALRGIAIVLVVVFHADGAVLFPFHNRVGLWPSLPLGYVYAGHTGVTLFFVLSGFLLSLPFLAAAYGGRPVSLRRFYERRALRILPLYYAAVVAATVLTAGSVVDLLRGMPYLLFLEAIPSLTVAMPPWSGVWWSLATEVQFYLVLPLVALAFGRPPAITLALLAIYALLYTAVAMGWLLPGLHPLVRSQSLVGRGPVFLAGMLAAWLWFRHGAAIRSQLARRRWLSAGGGDVLLAAVLVALGVLLQWASFRGAMPLDSSRRFVWHVPEGVLWTLVLLVVLLVPLRTKGVVSNRLFAWLGVLSYSIYVLHMPVLHYSLRLWRTMTAAPAAWSPTIVVWAVLAAAICLGLSTLTYRWIERPFLVRKARLGGGT